MKMKRYLEAVQHLILKENTILFIKSRCQMGSRPRYKRSTCWTCVAMRWSILSLWSMYGLKPLRRPKSWQVRESKPSWLSDRGSLAATLPSRRGLGALNQEDEAE